MSRTPGRLATATAVLVVSALVGGCSADEQDPEPLPTSSASETSEPSVSSPAADGTAYLPVPVGVELTPQGSELAVGDSAVVAWEPRQELVGVLDVTVTRLQLTSFEESFDGWQLDAKTRRSTPYFVRVSVTNVGESDVGGRDVPLYAVGPADTLIQASSFQADFEPCPGNGVFPETFTAGVARDLCLVYLVPDGGRLAAVSFRPVQEFDPITWTGPIDKPKKSKR
ncbi:MAG: hypothetical protein M3237_21420 [Actinomycetota bacterium]|nr:hypothetical protein [Actinomycetota bacterium]